VVDDLAAAAAGDRVQRRSEPVPAGQVGAGLRPREHPGIAQRASSAGAAGSDDPGTGCDPAATPLRPPPSERSASTEPGPRSGRSASRSEERGEPGPLDERAIGGQEAVSSVIGRQPAGVGERARAPTHRRQQGGRRHLPGALGDRRPRSGRR
jgi:hypothetical protein